MESLEKIGIKKTDADNIRNMTGSAGLLIAAGATGSGKTTTLYTLINEFKKQEKHIITIEDPIELVLDDIVQTDISESSYSLALKSVLRQDIDILFIGEIRDEESAKYIIRAAMTGHLILTTMHLTEINQVVNRLFDLGIPKSFIKQNLNGVFVQDLKFIENSIVPHFSILNNMNREMFQE
jgi:type IV pilus assembly protein PilB